ncbi:MULTISPECIES: tryptophan synthase subunit beta [Pseudomonas]|uniref:tryptophan synthase subunit beta n=1 Tax=Pseudomonas TaxID=286 RepID=UPI00249CB721|nr:MULTISPECIES: tryptophan synthase subunit beta [Pseudomonas]
MLYVQRDMQGQLVRVEAADFPGRTETLPADDQEVLAWYSNQSVETSLLQLKQSDLDMIRVLDDLLQLLMIKGVIRLTDLPAAAQAKLLNRNQAREALGGLNSLINEEEDGMI